MGSVSNNLSPIVSSNSLSHSGSHFSSITNFNSQYENGLFICSFNVNRLITHFNQVQYEIEQNNYDIVAICETFLRADIPDSVISIDGYEILRSDRKNRDGGGVILYFKKSITARILSTSADIHNYPSDFLIVDFQLKSEKLLFAIMYRPPRIEHPLQFFKDLERFLPSFRHAVITGDFNADMSYINFYSDPIFDFIAQNSLYLVPSELTCHTYHTDTHTWLDIFITTCPQAVIKFNKSTAPLYEKHDTIELTFNLMKPKIDRVVHRVRNFSTINDAELNNFIGNSFVPSALP